MLVASLRTIPDRTETWPPEQQERGAESFGVLDGPSGRGDLQVSGEFTDDLT